MARAMPLRKGHFGGPWSFQCRGSRMPYAAALVRSAHGAPAIDRSTTLATPNYSYEKRQRELAKKRKAEEKKQKKASGGRPGDGGSDEATGDAVDAEAPADGSDTPPAVA